MTPLAPETDLEAGGKRYSLKGARVYLHVTGDGADAIIHLDIDHPDLDKIFRPNEASYVGGRKGGIFVGFRTPQHDRAETLLKERRPD